MNHRERTNAYARLYVETKTLSDYLDEVETRIGSDYADEALIAWEAIDLYEGMHRPGRRQVNDP